MFFYCCFVEGTKIKLFLPPYKLTQLMSLKKIIFVTLTIFFVQQAFSQRNFDHYNRLGIQGGYVLSDISTSDLNTKQSEGFMFGFTTRGGFRNNFDLIYGLNYFNTKIEVFGRNGASPSETQYIDYTIQAVQINFLGSYNIIKQHLSIEIGPVLNISGKMKLKSDRFEDYILDGYDFLKAKEIESISPVNFIVAGGLTAGIENFRISGQYQYGVTNMLNKLNDKNLEENNDFKGNSSTITIMAIVYF